MATHIYTHVNSAKQKEIINSKHPRNKLEIVDRYIDYIIFHGAFQDYYIKISLMAMNNTILVLTVSNNCQLTSFKNDLLDIKVYNATWIYNSNDSKENIWICKKSFLTNN